MKNHKDLTIFFVSYFSKKNIKKIIINIPSSIKILIVDNANENGLKKIFHQIQKCEDNKIKI